MEEAGPPARTGWGVGLRVSTLPLFGTVRSRRAKTSTGCRGGASRKKLLDREQEDGVEDAPLSADIPDGDREPLGWEHHGLHDEVHGVRGVVEDEPVTVVVAETAQRKRRWDQGGPRAGRDRHGTDRDAGPPHSSTIRSWTRRTAFATHWTAPSAVAPS